MIETTKTALADSSSSEAGKATQPVVIEQSRAEQVEGGNLGAFTHFFSLSILIDTQRRERARRCLAPRPCTLHLDL